MAFANHLRIALGSSFELRTQIDVAGRQTYMGDDSRHALKAKSAEIGRMLDGLITSL